MIGKLKPYVWQWCAAAWLASPSKNLWSGGPWRHAFLQTLWLREVLRSFPLSRGCRHYLFSGPQPARRYRIVGRELLQTMLQQITRCPLTVQSAGIERTPFHGSKVRAFRRARHCRTHDFN